MGDQPGTYAAALTFNAQIDEAVAAGDIALAELRDPRTRHWKGKLAVFGEALRGRGHDVR